MLKSRMQWVPSTNAVKRRPSHNKRFSRLPNYSARGSRCSQGYSQEKCYCMGIKIHIELKNQFQTRNHTQATHLCPSYKTLCQPYKTQNHTQATHSYQPYTIHLYLFIQTLLHLVMQILCMSQARAPVSPDTASRILHKAPQL